jgi:predicted TIM-barrel fold metal-dependent hydrolase
MIPGPVTDIHVHIQPWRYHTPSARAYMLKGRADRALIDALPGDSGAALAWMDRTGIERIGIANYVSPDIIGLPPEINDWTAAYCARDRRRLIGFGSVHPLLHEKPEEEAVRLLDDLLLAGFKVHPPHQGFRANAYRSGLPSLSRIYEIAQARRRPLMIHTGTSAFPGARSRLGDPMDADDVAVDFPDLTIILSHAGRPFWCPQAFFLARRHPNVYLDLSGIPPRRILEWLPRLEIIADKCLFGTDWPDRGVESVDAQVAAFSALPLPETAKAAILSGTAARLFP